MTTIKNKQRFPIPFCGKRQQAAKKQVALGSFPSYYPAFLTMGGRKEETVVGKKQPFKKMVIRARVGISVSHTGQTARSNGDGQDVTDIYTYT